MVLEAITSLGEENDHKSEHKTIFSPSLTSGHMLGRALFGSPMRSTAKQPRRSDEQRDEDPVQERKL